MALTLATESVPARKPRAARKPAPSKAPASKRHLSRSDVVRVVAFAGLAVAGLAVSLPHLASEIGLLTGASGLGAWLLAITIDCGLCACKAHLSSKGPGAAVTWTVLGSCTALSMCLNCNAFYGHATPGFGQVAAIAFGCFLPLFVLALSYLATEIVLGHKGE